MDNDLIEFKTYQTIDTSDCLEITDYQIDHVEDNLLILKDTFGYKIASMETKIGKASLLSNTAYQHNIHFEDGMAIVVENDLYGVIDKQGNYIIKPEYIDIKYNKDNQTFWVREINYGLIDKAGKVLIDSKVSRITNKSSFIYNHAVITIVGAGGVLKQGLINSEGKTIIKPKYSRLFIIDDERLMYLKSKKKWCIMDYQERPIELKKYNDNIIKFHGKIAIVSNRINENRQYLMDLEGNRIGIDSTYSADTTWDFKYNTFSKNEFFGNNIIFDKEGKEIWHFIKKFNIYDDGTYLYQSNSTSFVGIYNALKRYNAISERKSPMDYCDYSDGYVVLRKGDTRYIVNHELQPINDKKYLSHININRKGRLIVVELPGYQYEVIDINGEVIVPCFQAETVFIFDDEHIIIDNHLVNLAALKYQYNLDIENEQNTISLVFDKKNKRDLYIECSKEELNSILENQQEKIDQIKQETNEKIIKLILKNK